MTVKTTKGNLTANREFLNYLCIALSEASDKLKLDGCLSDLGFGSLGDEIYDALQQSGFYKEG